MRNLLRCRRAVFPEAGFRQQRLPAVEKVRIVCRCATCCATARPACGPRPPGLAFAPACRRFGPVSCPSGAKPSECRVLCGSAFRRAFGCSKRNGQFAALGELETRYLDTLEANRILPCAHAQVVRHADRGNNESQFGGELLANARDPAEQRGVCAIRNEGNQTYAHLDRKRFNAQQIVKVLSHRPGRAAPGHRQ